MLENYGQGTHVLCRGCGQKIFVTGPVEVIIRNGRRLVEVECKRAHCSAYAQPLMYDEEAFEIHGTVR